MNFYHIILTNSKDLWLDVGIQVVAMVLLNKKSTPMNRITFISATVKVRILRIAISLYELCLTGLSDCPWDQHTCHLPE